MFRPDGSLLPHHQCPMADVLSTGVSVREQEVHIERPDGLRGIALVDIEAIKDSGGNVVGAVNCFQDITERKRSEAQIVNLAREAEHRTKNIMATVLATVEHSVGWRVARFCPTEGCTSVNMFTFEADDELDQGQRWCSYLRNLPSWHETDQQSRSIDVR